MKRLRRRWWRGGGGGVGGEGGSEYSFPGQEQVVLTYSCSCIMHQ